MAYLGFTSIGEVVVEFYSSYITSYHGSVIKEVRNIVFLNSGEIPIYNENFHDSIWKGISAQLV